MYTRPLNKYNVETLGHKERILIATSTQINYTYGTSDSWRQGNVNALLRAQYNRIAIPNFSIQNTLRINSGGGDKIQDSKPNAKSQGQTQIIIFINFIPSNSVFDQTIKSSCLWISADDFWQNANKLRSHT